MRNNSFNTLEDFMNNIHKLGYSIINVCDLKIPCLYIEDKLYDEILNISIRIKPRIDTNLNIYDDGKHVFVDIHIKFLDHNLEADILLYANDTMDFFTTLAQSAMLAFLPSNTKTTHNAFIMQLPKKDRIIEAFDLIQIKLNHK